MRFVVISGRSGSGKSTALHLLEDAGFICVDNLPTGLLPALVEQFTRSEEQEKAKFAVGIDARTIASDLNRLPEIINDIKLPETRCEVVYLDASTDILIKRFSETRRKHPLSNENLGLNEAIAQEQIILRPIAEIADIIIDTSTLSLHELRTMIKNLVVGDQTEGIALMFQSFGFKYGVPVDADFIFDVRCLPNPYWCQPLRTQTGLEQPVISFLREQPDVEAMLQDIQAFLTKWIPKFEHNNRSYLTTAIGCTGGMHRSVYLCEQLAEYFRNHYNNVQTRHKQLASQSKK